MTDFFTSARTALTEALQGHSSAFELRPASDDWLREEHDGALVARLMLVVFEPGSRDIRDVKEQELPLICRTDRERPERALAFLRAWARSLEAIVDSRGGELDVLMPMDLLVPEALNDSDLVTETDFIHAFGDRARLAAWAAQSELAEWQESLARCGLAERAQEVRALLRPAISFEDHERVDEDEDCPSPVGETRFGGEPDLPADQSWPTVAGRPMTFAAQLDLRALADHPAARELPREGVLSFFYDPFPEAPDGAVYVNAVRVMHFDASASLARRATPEGGDRRPAYRSTPRELSATLPPRESPFYEALLPEPVVTEFRRSLSAAARGQGSVVDPLDGLDRVLWNHNCDDPTESHRLLGYCQVHQGDPYLEAEVQRSGRGFDGWIQESPEAIAAGRRACRWRLLLQVCAYLNGALLLEQDAGYFYFLLPEEALARHDWSQAWGVLQCS
jgi:hypothetical protein